MFSLYYLSLPLAGLFIFNVLYMHLSRAIRFGIYVYISSFVTFGIVSLLPGMNDGSFAAYAAQWILTVIVLVLFAKWYFRKVNPTTKQGLYLGLVTIAVGLVIDAMFIVGIRAVGGSLDVFWDMYTDWKFYVSIGLVLCICTYLGYEFDTTFVEPEDTQK